MEWTAKSGTTLYEFLAFKVATRHDDSCWTWPGCHSKGGYPRVNVPGDKQRPAHKVAYELRYGPIPVGLEPDHLCRNRGCWNPDHTEPVTRSENVLRGAHPNRDRISCRAGHPYTSGNTRIYRRPDGRIERRCRKCQYWYRRRHAERLVTWIG